MSGAKAALAAVLLVGGMSALAFFGWRQNTPRPVSAPSAVIQTPIHPAMPQERTLVCRIVPQQAVWASAPREGTVDAVYVEVGQPVTDGQVLARMRSTLVPPAIAAMEQDASQEQARNIAVGLNGAQAESKRMQADVLRRRAAAARLESVFRKQELLNNAGATPRLVFERARDEYQAAVKELSDAEEASRRADNAGARLSDQKRDADAVAKEKAHAAAMAAAGTATAEIHAPAAGVVVERRMSAGDPVTDQTRAEMFRIAVHPELLRAEFESKPAAGQSVELQVAGARIGAVIDEAGGANFETRLASVTFATACSATMRIK